MRGVSRTLLRRRPRGHFCWPALFCAAAWPSAGATSLEDLLAGALTPSAAPALLGPITSAGRVGWECKPERAAAAARWHEAELTNQPRHSVTDARFPFSSPFLPAARGRGIGANLSGRNARYRGRPRFRRCARSHVSARSKSASRSASTPKPAATGQRAAPSSNASSRSVRRAARLDRATTISRSPTRICSETTTRRASCARRSRSTPAFWRRWRTSLRSI